VEKNPELKRHGRDAFVLWLRPDGQLILGHVGDSRIYGGGPARGASSRRTKRRRRLVRRGELTEAVASRLKFRSLAGTGHGRRTGAPIEPQIKGNRLETGDVWCCAATASMARSGRPGALQRQGLAEGKNQLSRSALVLAANEAGGPETSQCCWHGSCPRRA